MPGRSRSQCSGGRASLLEVFVSLGKKVGTSGRCLWAAVALAVTLAVTMPLANLGPDRSDVVSC